MYIVYVRTVYTQSADSAVSSSMDSSAQHRGSEAEPDTVIAMKNKNSQGQNFSQASRTCTWPECSNYKVNRWTLHNANSQQRTCTSTFVNMNVIDGLVRWADNW